MVVKISGVVAMIVGVAIGWGVLKAEVQGNSSDIRRNTVELQGMTKEFVRDTTYREFQGGLNNRLDRIEKSLENIGRQLDRIDRRAGDRL